MHLPAERKRGVGKRNSTYSDDQGSYKAVALGKEKKRGRRRPPIAEKENIIYYCRAALSTAVAATLVLAI